MAQQSASELLKSISEMELENERMRSDYLKLNESIETLRTKINTLEQKSLYNFVEIVGIPVSVNDNCVKIVEDIGAVLEIELTVVKAERLCYDGLTKSNRIVAQLLTYKQKLNLIKQSKQDELIISYEVENARGSCIHIHDYLTEYNRILYYHTKKFAREKGFKYVWYANCQIFIKKYDRSRIFLIEKESDLCGIK